MNLKDKVLLVTGASGGIGRAIAVESAKLGAEVLIHYRGNPGGAEETLKQVEKHSVGKIFQADLSEASSVAPLFRDIQKAHKHIDLLANNAGKYQNGKISDLDLWQRVFKNNFYSAVYVTNEFLKMKGSGGLRKIVNISSYYSFLETGVPHGMQYSVAKAAINSLTVNLAKQLAPEVLVNAVAPGYTMTPNWDTSSAEVLKTAADLARIKRMVKAEEIASMVVELFRNDAITGEIIRVDGGLHIPDTF